MEITKFNIELRDYDILNGCMTINADDEQIEIDNQLIIDCQIKIFYKEVSRGFEGDNSLPNGTNEIFEDVLQGVEVEIKGIWSEGICVKNEFTIHQFEEVQQLIINQIK